jgi:hypothetical protein
MEEMNMKRTKRTPEQKRKADREAKAAKRAAAKAVEIHEAAPPAPEPTPAPVITEPIAPEVTEGTTTPAAIVEARANVTRLQAELNAARITLRDLTRSPKAPRVPGVKTPAQIAHGVRSWAAPSAEQPEGGPLWRKFKSPAALAAKAQPAK